MTIFDKDEKSGLECGINRCGELYCGDDRSGYNLDDTNKNRAYLELDWKRYTGRTIIIPRI